MSAPIPASAAQRLAAPAFALALFSSAALIFVLQPLFGRMVTPLLGGSPSVWNASMAFFQGALLVGYVYAHLLARLKDLRSQVAIHIAFLVVAWFVLPLRVNDALGPPDSNHPALWLVGVLALSVGAPFAVASATAPLLQSWYARTGRPDAGDPYHLYAASNLGSFAGLILYPVVIEPLFGLRAQSIGWSAAYIVVAVLIVFAAGTALGARGAVVAPVRHRFFSSEIRWSQRLFWLAAAAVPSSLVLGVTLHISTDVASAPMLWVAPLALYLATFVMAFMRGGLRLEPTALLFHTPALALMVMAYFWAGDWVAALAGVLVGFFFSALVCHLALARTRPDAQHLTEFYLFVSLGGVLGGALTAFSAPLVFNNVYEFPLAMAAACLFRPRATPLFGRISNATAAGALMVLAMALLIMRLNWPDALIIVCALGAGGVLLAAGWAGEGEGENSPSLRYGFFVAAAAHAVLMIYLAFNVDTLFVEAEAPGDLRRTLAAPWSYAAVATSFLTLLFATHLAIQRQERTTRLVDIGIGLGLPGLLLAMFVGLGARLDASALAGAAVAFAALALVFNGARPIVMAGLVLIAFAIVFLDDIRGGRIITQERSFFGVLRTRVLSDGTDPNLPELRVLLHGTTIHGAQLATPGMTRRPLTYYNPNTALGEAILAGLSTGESSSLALIGLGAGSTACLMQPQDRLTIFEIDPAVVRLSTGAQGDFTYVPECQPNARVELGDARLRIGDEPDESFDVIVVDAFSSDAIPAHLLTQEALALYLRKTSDRGIVVLHLSNRNLALVSEAARLSRDLNVPHLFRVSDRISTPQASLYGGLPASVMILARSPLTLAQLPLASRPDWRVLEAPPGRAWSDDYIALPRALWESANGAEECLTYPYLKRCGEGAE